MARFVTRMKRRAEETVEGISQIINTCLANVSPAVYAAVPRTSALQKTIQRTRKQMQAAPLDPVSLDYLVLPMEYKIYWPTPDVEEPFLLGNFREGLRRIQIFGRNSCLYILQSSDTWMALLQLLPSSSLCDPSKELWRRASCVVCTSAKHTNCCLSLWKSWWLTPNHRPFSVCSTSLRTWESIW